MLPTNRRKFLIDDTRLEMRISMTNKIYSLLKRLNLLFENFRPNYITHDAKHASANFHLNCSHARNPLRARSNTKYEVVYIENSASLRLIQEKSHYEPKLHTSFSKVRLPPNRLHPLADTINPIYSSATKLSSPYIPNLSQ